MEVLPIKNSWTEENILKRGGTISRNNEDKIDCSGLCRTCAEQNTRPNPFSWVWYKIAVTFFSASFSRQEANRPAVLHTPRAHTRSDQLRNEFAQFATADSTGPQTSQEKRFWAHFGGLQRAAVSARRMGEIRCGADELWCVESASIKPQSNLLLGCREERVERST